MSLDARSVSRSARALSSIAIMGEAGTAIIWALAACKDAPAAAKSPRSRLLSFFLGTGSHQSGDLLLHLWI
jgi:hypothetical protein